MRQGGFQKSVLTDVVEVVAKMLRIATTPRTNIESYLVTIKVNLREPAISAALTQEGEDHMNQKSKIRKLFKQRKKDICTIKELK